MDAVEFVKTVNRLCRNQGCCKECPIGEEWHCLAAFDNESIKSIEETVSKVEQWSKDHPVKTRQSEFLKMFPDAQTKDDVIWMCPKYISYDYEPGKGCSNISCSDCKRDYWLAEMTDND